MLPPVCVADVVSGRSVDGEIGSIQVKLRYPRPVDSHVGRIKRDDGAERRDDQGNGKKPYQRTTGLNFLPER